MSNITAAAVGSLRSRTGVSMMACKKALDEAGGDEEKAIEILRSRGEAQAVKKGERDQGEGSIFIASGSGKAALVQINCETDFVARNDAFKELGQDLANTLLAEGNDGLKTKAEAVIPEAVQTLGENISLGEIHLIDSGTVGSYVHSNGKIGVIIALDGGTEDAAKDAAMHAAAMNPMYVSPDEVEDEAVAKEKAIWTEQLKDEGKPQEIMDKIMIGKEKKFREENALLTQEFVKDPSMTVGQYLGTGVTTYLRVSIG